jgi:hypothetical protein
MPQVEECLPSKCKALSSNPNITKKKKNEKRNGKQPKCPSLVKLVKYTVLYRFNGK